MREQKIAFFVIASLILVIDSSASSAVTPTMGINFSKPETAEPNPPEWPHSVRIIRPTDDPETIQELVKDTQDPWKEDEQTFSSDHHFSSERYAILFTPGVYENLDLEVGYYSQVLGLGTRADDVIFTGPKGIFVPALNRHLHKNGTCLDTFWRSAENFKSVASEGMRWAVSQAAPLRRVHVATDLYLHDKGAYASGGHIANCVVDGHTHGGGQQQFLHRNVEFKNGTSGGAWSMVYVGCSGKVPEPSIGSENTASITVVEHQKVRLEKPYISMSQDGTFQLRVPRPITAGTTGPLINGENEESRDFQKVRVVKPNDTTSSIQQALDAGLDILLTPGIYKLTKTLYVHKPHQVVLGIGLATLEAPDDGSPCIHVKSGVPGVRIAGLMLEATEIKTKSPTMSSLLEWGEDGVKDAGDSNNPGSLFDIFCRVGGATAGNRKAISVDTMVRLHSGSLYGDNLWLWRADHGELGPGEKANYPHISPIYHQAEQDEFRVENGIVVNGDDVHIDGLAVEHANGHQTIWKGENGVVNFYQCEFPYGVTDEAFAKKEYRGYVVDDSVLHHQLNAPGIYSNFRNEEVAVSTAIEHPISPTVLVQNPFTVRLDNNFGIRSILNGMGGAAVVQGVPMRLDPSPFVQERT